MADKRTTPDPADHARRKRPAPTIDLEATEMPAAGEPPVTPDPAQEQPEAARETEPADGDNVTYRTRGTWPAALPTLFAGFAGAVIITAVLFALWFAGLVPGRYRHQPVLIGIDRRTERTHSKTRGDSRQNAGERSSSVRAALCRR